MEQWPVLAAWAVLAGALAAYLLAFALRREVSLRPARLAVLAAAAGTARLLLTALGYPVAWPVDGGLTILLLASIVGLLAARRFWLVRATEEAVRVRIQSACGGLFLPLAEPVAGRLVVTARGQEHRLLLVRLGQELQGLVLCPRPDRGKVRLLVDWLAKQYPGPVPRVRITLAGGKS